MKYLRPLVIFTIMFFSSIFQVEADDAQYSFLIKNGYVLRTSIFLKSTDKVLLYLQRDGGGPIYVCAASTSQYVYGCQILTKP